jgi:hypothetical protein
VRFFHLPLINFAMSPLPGFKLPFSFSSFFADSRFSVVKTMYADGRRFPEPPPGPEGFLGGMMIV